MKVPLEVMLDVGEDVDDHTTGGAGDFRAQNERSR